MWEAICMTLLATAGNNIGKGLQKKGTVILPPLSFKLKVIRAYVSNRLWLIGFLMDIFGALLMLKALSEAPVSVIQPASGGGLAILSVFSHFYLEEVVNTLDWIGITLAGFGTIAVGVGGEEQSDSKISVLDLPWLILTVAVLFIFLNAVLRLYKNRRREQELIHYEVVEEIIVGLESGILFGLASVISKMGFLFSEQGHSRIFVPACISISICCSATGFVFQAIHSLDEWLREAGLDSTLLFLIQRVVSDPGALDDWIWGSIGHFWFSCIRFWTDWFPFHAWFNAFLDLGTRGLKQGRAIVVSTCAAVASMVTGVLAGMLALGERLPLDPLSRLCLLLGWVLIVVGVILLVSSSRLIPLLPRPLRHFLRSNRERSHNLRRPGSMRPRDPSPGTIIQSSALHPLIASPAKAKA